MGVSSRYRGTEPPPLLSSTITASSFITVISSPVLSSKLHTYSLSYITYITIDHNMAIHRNVFFSILHYQYVAVPNYEHSSSE